MPEQPPEAKSWKEQYPNLSAILDGRMSGAFREWPQIRPELRKFGEEFDAIRSENTRLQKELDEFRTAEKKLSDAYLWAYSRRSLSSLHSCITTLRKALERYGSHTMLCTKLLKGSGWFKGIDWSKERLPCSCGLDDALAQAKVRKET